MKNKKAQMLSELEFGTWIKWALLGLLIAFMFWFFILNRDSTINLFELIPFI